MTNKKRECLLGFLGKRWSGTMKTNTIFIGTHCRKHTERKIQRTFDIFLKELSVQSGQNIRISGEENQGRRLVTFLRQVMRRTHCYFCTTNTIVGHRLLLLEQRKDSPIQSWVVNKDGIIPAENYISIFSMRWWNEEERHPEPRLK